MIKQLINGWELLISLWIKIQNFEQTETYLRVHSLISFRIHGMYMHTDLHIIIKRKKCVYFSVYADVDTHVISIRKYIIQMLISHRNPYVRIQLLKFIPNALQNSRYSKLCSRVEMTRCIWNYTVPWHAKNKYHSYTY